MTTIINEKFYDIIRRPLITEKANISTEIRKYSFEVSLEANKSDVKNAIEAIFGIKVLQVNILNTKGKRKFFRNRKGFRSGFKKAIVTLAQGQTLDIMLGG